jgi:hypothetical protein
MVTNYDFGGNGKANKQSHYLLHAGSLLGFFNPEDGGVIILRNIG